jgi:VIT1/CCC1 family predicted Fe2+/Mn2+ transporter
MMSSQSNAVTRKMQQGDNILNKYWNAFSKDASDQLGATEAAIYTVGALVIVVGYHIASDGIFSSIVTLASVIQFLGLVLTLVKVSKKGIQFFQAQQVNFTLFICLLFVKTIVVIMSNVLPK